MDPHTLPADLPAPPDDGACAHLTDQPWPTPLLPPAPPGPPRADGMD